MSAAPSLDVVVSEVESVAPRVKRFRLVAPSGATLPAFSPGAHILVTLAEGRNAYSLMGSPSDHYSYQISVLHTEPSRGGSRWLHENVEPGARLTISHPVNLFPLAQLGRKHVFVAGGIGITPFLPMMEELHARAVPFELHYAARSREHAAYLSEIAQVKFYETGTAARPTMANVLARQPLGTHLYVCGPERMIEDVTASARAAGWPAGHLHSERFAGGSAGDAFTVTLARSKRTIPVNAHQSVLEALEAAGVEAPFLCRGGSCGACETGVLACDRPLLHRDHYLSQDERRSAAKIMICVSRADGGDLILDL
jgi:dimethylamine monooxygenase subunit B